MTENGTQESADHGVPSPNSIEGLKLRLKRTETKLRNWKAMAQQTLQTREDQTELLGKHGACHREVMRSFAIIEHAVGRTVSPVTLMDLYRALAGEVMSWPADFVASFHEAHVAPTLACKCKACAVHNPPDEAQAAE